MTTMTIAKAINEGLRATLSNNPKSLLMGDSVLHYHSFDPFGMLQRQSKADRTTIIFHAENV